MYTSWPYWSVPDRMNSQPIRRGPRLCPAAVPKNNIGVHLSRDLQVDQMTITTHKFVRAH